MPLLSAIVAAPLKSPLVAEAPPCPAPFRGQAAATQVIAHAVLLLAAEMPHAIHQMAAQRELFMLPAQKTCVYCVCTYVYQARAPCCQYWTVLVVVVLSRPYHK